MTKFTRLLKFHWLAILITATFFVLASLYSSVTPLFESPDELWHYPVVWHLAHTWELPVQEPANPQMWQQEGSQPPLYYAIAALLTGPLSTDDLPALLSRNPHADIGVVRPDGNANIVVHTDQEAWPWQGTVLAVHIARFFSVFLGTITVLCVYALGRTLWPERQSLALVAMAFVAFNPMFIFISGSVNNDNLITFLATLMLWLLVTLTVTLETDPRPRSLSQNLGRGSLGWGEDLSSKKPSTWWFVGFGILGGLAALSKLSGLGLVGLIGLTLLWQGWRRRSWWIAIAGNAIVGVFALVTAAWWYWRNIQLYGDWSGTATMVAMMGPRSVPPTARQLLAEIPGLMRSFWGLFGYFSVPLPFFLYWLFNGLFLAGFAGLILAVLSPRRTAKVPPRLGRVWPILVGWIIILLIGFVRWTLRTPATQGRLLFPMLGVVAVLWAIGWLALAPPANGHRRTSLSLSYKKLQWVWSVLPGAALLIVAIWVPWGVISPAYTRPEPLAELPPSAQALDAIFGNGIHLLGYDSNLTAVRPGEALPLTLYWQSDTPTEKDYSLFIHLLDENDLIVAQRNVFHGPGVYPTSQWRPGEIFADNYSLDLPNTAFTPNQARFEVGLYDHLTGARLPVSTDDDHIRFGAIEIQERREADFPNQQFLLFEDMIALVGYDVNQRQMAAGQTLTLTLYWQSKASPSDDYKIFVHLVGEGEARIAQHDSAPQNGAAPTSSWEAGQTVVDKHPLITAADAPPGAYRLVVGLYDGETGQRLRLLQDGDASVQADSVTLTEVRIVNLSQ